MSNLYEAICSLGVSDMAAKLYLNLLQNRGLNITETAKQMGTYRRRIYELKTELTNFGLLENSPDLIPKSPKIILSLIEEKKFQTEKIHSDLQSDLPNLLASFSMNSKATEIQIFEGENRFLRLFYTILEEVPSGSEILSYNEGNDLYRWLDMDYFRDIWIEKRIAKSIFIRILSNGDNKLLSTEQPRDRQKYRETRVMQNNVTDLGAFWVLPHAVILWDTQSPKAIWIQNSTITSCLRNIFETSWLDTQSQRRRRI